MNIVLAGMPGSGKTTVARILAEMLGARVVDTDEEIVKEYGAITEIFDKFGEECFRNMESDTVAKISALDGVVVSTGGGCLLRGENVANLRKTGKIVFLKAGFETLLRRVEGDTSRPLLAGDASARMSKLLKERTPVYERAADMIIETDGLTPDEVAKKITELLK